MSHAGKGFKRVKKVSHFRMWLCPNLIQVYPIRYIKTFVSKLVNYDKNFNYNYIV